MEPEVVVSTPNPLGREPKREKSGSDTFKKYNYQYHWAFCRILDEYEDGNEFAIFIEEHEDVILANNLSGEIATFEFNQVKETNRTHTVDSLTKKSGKQLHSLIEKLALSACNKSFSDSISKVNFVSTGGYSFQTHKNGFKLEIIQSGDLTREEIGKIDKCLTSIVGGNAIIPKLAFIIPDLPEKGFDLATEGKISCSGQL
jgi:hypothetical protein